MQKSHSIPTITRSKRKVQVLILAVLASSLVLLAACSQGANKTPTLDANMVLTEAGQTVAAQLTQHPPAAATPVPTNPPLPTPTDAQANPLPTATVNQPAPPAAVTNTPTPIAATAAPKDNASFVADVTVPDGTGATPGSHFPKTWRIKNNGVTTWTTAYSLVPVDGDRMGSPDSIPMPNDVRPGETVDITVNLIAPVKEGAYQTFFRLRNAAGQFFRLDGTGDLWVKISVGGVAITPNLTQTAAYTPSTPTLTKTPTLTITPTP